jgi:predicted RecA/RadA family phage recombinase
MQAQFIHDGRHIDFTPEVDVPVGSIVIQGDLVGITKRDLKAGVLGTVAVEGVFDIPKDPADAEVFTMGQKVYATNDGIVTDVDTGTVYLGKVVADAAATDKFVRVRLSQ